MADSAELSSALEAISARFEALMTDPAETLLILRPLSLLSHLYEQDRQPQLPDAPAPEVCIHWRRADINIAQRISHDISHHAEA